MASMLQEVFSRWFALLSGIFATLAWHAAYESLGDTGSLSVKCVKGAAIYTAGMLGVFSLLAAVSFRYRKQLEAASQTEAKEGVLQLSPSDLMALTVDDGISNLTSAMSSMLAGIWFGLAPSMPSAVSAAVFMGAGSVVLLIGEAIRRSLQKGSAAEYIMNLLNGLNISSVSWWVGYPLSNFTQEILGVSAGESSKVKYWMWGVAFVAATINIEILSAIATRIPKGADGKVYGNSVLRMLKGVPLYSSGLILYNITQLQFEDNYLVGSLIWLVISSVAIVFSDQVMRMAEGKLSNISCCADPKDFVELGDEAVSLLGQTMSYVCGQLGSSALAAMLPKASALLWLLFTAVFQIVSMALQDARTDCLPTMFKAVGSYTTVVVEESKVALTETAATLESVASNQAESKAAEGTSNSA